MIYDQAMRATVAKAPNASERISQLLTRQILRGAYPPGMRLPTVRDLADAHGVNPATMQRALARLESRGLVTARQGSGLQVNDPQAVGDISLVPDWLAATADDPDRAASILADLLEVRRVLAARLIARHRLAVVDAVADLVTSAGDLLSAPADQIWRADLDFARVIIAATGNTVAGAVLNSLGRALAEQPVLVAAMYDDPARNVASMLDVVAAVRDGGDDLADRVEATIAAIDGHTVATFARLLGEQRAQDGPS